MPETTDTAAAIDFPIAALAEYFGRADNREDMIARAKMVQNMASDFLTARVIEESGRVADADEVREVWYAAFDA